MAKESSQHKGHRQRMRARVEQYGLESLEPHEALEYVLYITNTRKDTNGLAHVLIDRFGDFAGVLDASEEDLLTVEGVGPSTARFFIVFPTRIYLYNIITSFRKRNILECHSVITVSRVIKPTINISHTTVVSRQGGVNLELLPHK